VTTEARRRGAIIRPLGDVIVLMPPLAISKRDLRRLVAITTEAIGAAVASVGAPDPVQVDTVEIPAGAEIREAA
jgi:adenosylmethionine---8-amino-7-oxononanoate aminotransferase